MHPGGVRAVEQREVSGESGGGHDSAKAEPRQGGRLTFKDLLHEHSRIFISDLAVYYTPKQCRVVRYPNVNWPGKRDGGVRGVAAARRHSGTYCVIQPCTALA